MKTLLVGAGNMGRTYAQSFLAAHVLRPSDLTLLVRDAHKAATFAGQHSITALHTSAGEYIADAELIVLAVKPQDAAVLYPMLAPFVRPDQPVLSVMAGIRIATLAQALGTPKIVRAMPNLPAQVGMGMTAFTASPEVTRQELIAIQNLLSTTGRAIYFDDETMVDASTAVSGSGPAFVFYFMDAMLKAARGMGFSESEAELMVWQTFNGAIHLINKNNLTCSEWIQKVASKGGTTEAALRTFGEAAVSDAIGDGLRAAFARAKELGK